MSQAQANVVPADNAAVNIAQAAVPAAAAAPAPAANAANTANAAAAQNNVNIADQQVPLAVNDDTTDDITEIEDEETPLASNGTAKDGLKNWWWWIAGAVAAVVGKGAYDSQRRKPAKNKNSDEDSEEK